MHRRFPGGIFLMDRYHFFSWVYSPPSVFRAMRGLFTTEERCWRSRAGCSALVRSTAFTGRKLSDRCLLVCHDTVVATVKFGSVAALWERVTWPSRPKNANNRCAATVFVPRHYPRSGSDEGSFGSRNPHANVGCCHAGCFAKKSRSLSHTASRR